MIFLWVERLINYSGCLDLKCVFKIFFKGSSYLTDYVIFEVAQLNSTTVIIARPVFKNYSKWDRPSLMFREHPEPTIPLSFK